MYLIWWYCSRFFAKSKHYHKRNDQSGHTVHNFYKTQCNITTYKFRPLLLPSPSFCSSYSHFPKNDPISANYRNSIWWVEPCWGRREGGVRGGGYHFSSSNLIPKILESLIRMACTTAVARKGEGEGINGWEIEGIGAEL